MTKIIKSEYGNIKKLFENKENIANIAKKYKAKRTQIYYILRVKCGVIFNDAPKNDLTGKTFGLLTVLRMDKTEKSKGGRYRAICECKCGNKYYDACPHAIRRGQTTSCGCRKDQYEKISGKNNKNFKGYEEIRGGRWEKLRKKAKSRSQEFNITIRYAWDLFIKQNKKCALSGIPICFGVESKRKSIITASLDRIDSNKGYVEGNVQWVHKDVNVMKNMFNQKYFINICRAVAKNKNLNLIEKSSGVENILDFKTNYFGDKMRNLK